MERDQAVRLTQNLLKKMVENNGSDLFITADFPPAIKIDGTIRPFADRPLTPAQSSLIVRSIMNDKQAKEFDATKECNFAIAPQGIGRFRVSAFVQQGNVGAVIRTIVTKIPTFEDLDLPAQLKEVAMTKRGLCLVVGGTGSGKSTTLAAMIGYRNENSRGHIITIEDPVEYVHPHRGCVVTHREVGVDTDSWHNALKNTLRQAPDVIMIGEIRDRETMQYGIQFAETGHLCVATLHANSANQALDRIINFFPEERRHQLLMDLSLNITAMISQRLLPRENKMGRVRGHGDHAGFAADQRPDFPRRGGHDQRHHGEIESIGHADVRSGAVPALRRRCHCLRRSDSQRGLEERAAPQDQAAEQARRCCATPSTRRASSSPTKRRSPGSNGRLADPLP